MFESALIRNVRRRRPPISRIVLLGTRTQLGHGSRRGNVSVKLLLPIVRLHHGLIAVVLGVEPLAIPVAQVTLIGPPVGFGDGDTGTGYVYAFEVERSGGALEQAG